LWIVSKQEKIEQSDLNAAALENCPEILNGIPPALVAIIEPSDLPIAYEEPEPPVPEKPIDALTEIDLIKEEITAIKKRLDDSAIK